MTELTEQSLESALASIKALIASGEARLTVEPTRIEISQVAIAHFGSAEAAYNACAALMAERGYFWDGKVHARLPIKTTMYGSTGQ